MLWPHAFLKSQEWEKDDNICIYDEIVAKQNKENETFLFMNIKIVESSEKVKDLAFYDSLIKKFCLLFTLEMMQNDSKSSLH